MSSFPWNVSWTPRLKARAVFILRISSKPLRQATNSVTIYLKQTDGAFLNKVAGFLFIVPKNYVSQLETPEAFAAAPIGSGPFKVKEFKIG
jgi:peptide/nickel transport system substrate-binding protein